MRYRTLCMTTLAATLVLVGTLACASAAAPVRPQIERVPLPAQAAGVPHTLRVIPEACVRLQGRFPADPAQPYVLEIVPKAPCRPRTRFVPAGQLADAPSAATGWILNDELRIPNAACSDQQAVVQVWRRQVDPTSVPLDAQGRLRLNMAAGQPATTMTGARAGAVSLFTAVLAGDGRCG